MLKKLSLFTAFLAVFSFAQVASNVVTAVTYASIQAAVNAASNSEAVAVLTGVHSNNAIVIQGKTNFSLRSLSYQTSGINNSNTQLRTFASQPCIQIVDCSNVSVFGFYINNGFFIETSGILIERSPSCQIALNTIYYYASNALTIDAASPYTLVRSNFINIPRPATLSNAVDVWSVSNSFIGNTIARNWGFDTAAVFVNTNAAGQTFANNIFLSNQTGIWLTGDSHVIASNSFISASNASLQISNSKQLTIVSNFFNWSYNQEVTSFDMSSSLFSRNYFSSNHAYGVKLYGASFSNTFEFNTFRTNTSSAISLWSDGADDNRIVSNTFNGGYLGDRAVLINGADGTLILSNIITTMDNEGIKIYGAAVSNLILNNYISTNWINGIVILSNAARANVIASNRIQGPQQNYGIWLEDCAENLISSNYINAQTYDGMIVTGIASSNLIENNRITSNDYSGVHIFSNVGIGNLFVSNELMGTFQDTAFWLTNSTSNVFKMNTAVSNLLYGIRLEGACAGNVFSLNNIYAQPTNLIYVAGNTFVSNWWGSLNGVTMMSNFSASIPTNEFLPYSLRYINYRQPDFTSPNSPIISHAIYTNGGVELRWSDQSASGAAYYRVWRLIEQDTWSNFWVPISTTTATNYLDTNLIYCSNNYYYITAYDTNVSYPNECWWSGAYLKFLPPVASNTDTGVVYPRIQTACTRAQSNQTVVVFPGKYFEQLEIDTNGLRLIAYDWLVNTNNTTTLLDRQLNLFDAVRLSATNQQVIGFTFSGDIKGVNMDAEQCVVANNIFKCTGSSTSSTPASISGYWSTLGYSIISNSFYNNLGPAIYFTQCTNVRITANQFFNTNSQCVFIVGSSNLQIDNNIISNIVLTREALYVSDSFSLIVQSNLFKNLTNVFVLNSVSGANILNNTFESCRLVLSNFSGTNTLIASNFVSNSPNRSAGYYSNCNGVTLIDNEFYSPQSGAFFTNSHNIDIRGNTISAGADYALKILGVSSNIQIRNNTISANTNGILLTGTNQSSTEIVSNNIYSGYWGVRLYGPGVYISSNYFRNSRTPFWDDAAIRLETTSVSNVISANYFHTNSFGIRSFSGWNKISSNSFYSNITSLVIMGSNNEIILNDFSATRSTNLLLGASGNIVLLNNICTNGIQLGAGAFSNAIASNWWGTNIFSQVVSGSITSANKSNALVPFRLGAVGITQADVQPPLIPTSVVAVSSLSNVIVSWDDMSASGAVKYNIWRSMGVNSFTNLSAPLSVTTSTSYTDSTLATGITAWYFVTAIDNPLTAYSNESWFSSSVSGKLLEVTASNTTTGTLYTSIQDAVDAASVGQTVAVFNSTNSESVVISGKTNITVAPLTWLSSQTIGTVIMDTGNVSKTSFTINACEGVSIKGFEIRGGMYGVVITNSGNGNLVASCLILSNAVAGVYFVNSTGSIAQSNTVMNNLTDGIVFGTGAAACRVVGSSILSNSNAGVAAYAETADGNFVMSNNIASPSQNYGVFITNGDNNLIQGNIISSAQTAGICIGDSASANILAVNTISSNCQGVLLYGAASSGNSVVSNIIGLGAQTNGIIVASSANHIYLNNILQNSSTGVRLLASANGNIVELNNIYNQATSIEYAGVNSIHSNFYGSALDLTGVSALITGTSDTNIIAPYRLGSLGVTSQADVLPPSVPTNVKTTSDTNEVTVTWDVVAGAAVYRVYRSENTDSWAGFTTAMTQVSTANFTDTTLGEGTNAWYFVTSVDDPAAPYSNESWYSASARGKLSSVVATNITRGIKYNELQTALNDVLTGETIALMPGEIFESVTVSFLTNVRIVSMQRLGLAANSSTLSAPAADSNIIRIVVSTGIIIEGLNFRGGNTAVEIDSSADDTFVTLCDFKSNTSAVANDGSLTELVLNNFSLNITNLNGGASGMAVSNYYGARDYASKKIFGSWNQIDPWMNAAIQASADTLPPLPVVINTASNTVLGVKVTWTSSTETDTAGYKIFSAVSANYSNIADADYVGLTMGRTNSQFVDNIGADGSRYYFVTSIDTNGNESFYGAGVAVSVANPPTAVAFSPAAGLTNAPTNLIVSLTFSEPVTTNGGSFRLIKISDSSVMSEVSNLITGSGTTNLLIDFGWVDAGTFYRVEFAAGVLVDGLGISNLAFDGSTWQFTTEGISPANSYEQLGFDVMDDLSKAKVLHNPWRGESDGMVFVNLPEECQAAVYTVSGSLVVSIEKEEFPGVLIWNIENDKGEQCSPGMYLVRLIPKKGDPKIVNVAVEKE